MKLPFQRYPVELIDVVTLAGGERILVRPVLPQDLDLHRPFFDSLSKASRFNRFFNPRPNLSGALLERLTNVDHATHLALIAEVISEERETVVAEARYMTESDGGSAEFAIAVADRYQRRGLGYGLLTRLMGAARRSGISQLFGSTMSVNVAMLRLALKLDFAAAADPRDATVTRLTLPLKRDLAA